MMSTAIDVAPEQRAGALGTKHGADLTEGDILFFLSTPHRITHFHNYRPLFLTDQDRDWRIAFSGRSDDSRCWSMTIDPDLSYWVA